MLARLLIVLGALGACVSAQAATTQGDFTIPVLRTFIGLIVVLVLIGATAYLAKRFNLID
ncbi:MAG: hypothetical protein AAF384_13070 [Pseudomonadota bacterium]